MSFINKKAIKDLAKEHGRRVGRDFMNALDLYIEHKIIAACKEHNGGKITLDNSLAYHVGLRK